TNWGGKALRLESNSSHESPAAVATRSRLTPDPWLTFFNALCPYRSRPRALGSGKQKLFCAQVAHGIAQLGRFLKLELFGGLAHVILQAGDVSIQLVL